jgi:hypothetical protein
VDFSLKERVDNMPIFMLLCVEVQEMENIANIGAI